MTWALYADWDRNGNFTGTYDDITADVRETLSWSLGCRPFQLMGEESSLSFRVYNASKKYSVENSSSPLYGKLTAGVPVRLKFGSVNMWTGYIKEIQPDPLAYGKRMATITCADPKHLMQRHPVYVSLYQNVTADQVIRDIALQFVNPPELPNVWRLGYSQLGVNTVLGSITDVALLDTGVTVFETVGDNAHSDTKQMSAYELINDLVQAERGRFFFNRDGKVEFWNRQHLWNDLTIDLTVDNTQAALKYITPEKDLVNHVAVTCYPRQVSGASSEVVWQLHTPITIPAGQEMSIEVPYKTAAGRTVGANDIQTPSGLDLAFSYGTATVSVKGFGQRAKITFRNTTGDIAICETLILRGQTYDSSNPLTVEQENGTSILKHGRRSLSFDLRALNSEEQARNVAKYELNRRADDTARVESLTVWEQVASAANDQINYGIGSRIQVKDTQLAHDKEYYIVGERHALESKSKKLQTEWLLEPAGKHVVWVLGTSKLGVDTILGF